jgi:hypothetical protein
VGVAATYGLGGRVLFSAWQDFLFFAASIPALRLNHPPIQWVPWAISPGLKKPGCEADHSPPSSAEVKNGGAIPPLPCMTSWHSAYLIKHRDNCIFLTFLVN